MKFVGATVGEAASAERTGAQALVASYAKGIAQAQPRETTIRTLVDLYRASPEFKRLATKTRSEWGRWLDIIAAELGSTKGEWLSRRGTRAALEVWRDRRSDRPRAADYGVQVLKRLLSFGVVKELIDRNPAADIGKLYKSKRADIVVEEEELAAILDHVPPRARYAIRLAAATGMRRGDLQSLKWSDVVRDTHLSFLTEKSGQTIRALVPLVGDGMAVIEELRKERQEAIDSGRHPSEFVLTSQRGTPWTLDAITNSFIRGAKEAQVQGKSLHDLRGTAITRFVCAGWNDEEVALVVGWEPARVRQIRTHYVDGARVAKSLVERVERARGVR